MAPISKTRRVKPNVESDEEKQSTRKTPTDTQSAQDVEKVTSKNRQQIMLQSLASGSRKARKTPKAKEGIVSGTDRSIPPQLAKLRRSTLYLEDIPRKIDRDELNQWIERQIVEDGLEEEDLVETWHYFYEEASFLDAFPYDDEGFRSDDV
mmetsp:Transcript_28669/g.41053  ORF Transcript_28669/g.41053 Transcript_28669/m.41053 type:complete len:151 (+) Transcript_28669:416-868(+)|eukprot:CAMPEP_0172421478 /NCGR_PEP_ID=MMETSP1064-20121228/7727_1 /TAXON_ID=202472 /ORGANISM="Aulacoseira subarctica , Strain CCAP 1002/5" /LENGTH=150 /DNA_ID=CAMNT_0013161907 /DNA_START=402 /DNA_END=854 /DNA_ORIENTATION=-